MTASPPIVSVTEIQSQIMQMTLDLPGTSANILSEQMYEHLDAAITPLMHRKDIKGLVLVSAKPRIFVAGADLNAIQAGLDWPDEKIHDFSRRGRGVMEKFNQCPFVTVAAIHGACVGGGLELTLWCDHRIASNEKTLLGLPEVKLGLIPGWAGTVRIARIANLETQLDLVTSGRLVTAEQAHEMGIVDAVCDREEMISVAVQRIEKDWENQTHLRRREQQTEIPDLDVNLEQVRDQYAQCINDASITLHPFAPGVALEHTLRAYQMPAEDAYHSEAVAFAKVWGSPSCYGLMNHFFLGEHNRRHPGFVNVKDSERKIQKVGIVGAGIMGQSIAANNLKRRKSVVLFDTQQKTAADAVNALKEKGEIEIAQSIQDLADCDLVIESVTEDAAVKQTVLKQIESAVSTEALIATNTSAIPIHLLATALTHPDRFCGIHFCHPELMDLVEVIGAEKTGSEPLAAAANYVRSLGKMAVSVRDRAGFVVNRMLASMLDASFRLVSHGQSIASVDKAMREFGFRGGPFEIVDVIGADTCVAAGRAMWEAGVRCVTTSPLLPRMVKLGRLGRKSQQGFYRYESQRGEAIKDPSVDQLAQSYAESEKSSKLSNEQIVHQIVATMAFEATCLLEEKVVADHRDIDIAVINGFSFPAHEGGVLFWADRLGIQTVVNTLESISEIELRLAPNARLLQMSQANETFYELPSE